MTALAAGSTSELAEFNLWWALAKAGLALAVLLPVAVWITRFYAVKSSGLWTGLRHGGLVRVLDVVPLGPQRSLAVVAVAGRVLVVASTPQSVSVLLEIDDPAEVSQLLAGAGVAGNLFSDLVRGALTRWSRRERDEADNEG